MAWGFDLPGSRQTTNALIGGAVWPGDNGSDTGPFSQRPPATACMFILFTTKPYGGCAESLAGCAESLAGCAESLAGCTEPLAASLFTRPWTGTATKTSGSCKISGVSARLAITALSRNFGETITRTSICPFFTAGKKSTRCGAASLCPDSLPGSAAQSAVGGKRKANNTIFDTVRYVTRTIHSFATLRVLAIIVATGTQQR